LDKKLDEKEASGLTKVYFTLDASDWHGKSSESLWAEVLSVEKFKLKNSPFFAKGISFEDIVLTEKYDGKKYYIRTAISSGHSTYRIILEKTMTEHDFRRFWLPLQNIGCSYESTSIDFLIYAVDVPPKTNIYYVFDLLSAGESAGIWGFDEGHCGHLL